LCIQPASSQPADSQSPHPPPNIHPHTHTHTSTAFLCSVYCKHQPAGTLAATPHNKQNTKTKVPVLSVTIVLTVDIPRRISCGTQKKVRVMCIHQLILSLTQYTEQNQKSQRAGDVHFHKLIMPHTLGGTDRSKFPQVIFPMYIIGRKQRGKTKCMFLSLHIHSFLRKSHADYNSVTFKLRKKDVSN